MSKKDIVNMIVETYSAQSRADKEFLDLHAPIITTHYSPEYPDMDDILTARHINTYVRREHGRNHPVAGEAFSKANQTRQAMYNQDHGYMPDEDANYSFPHPSRLSEEHNKYFARHLTAFNKLVKKHGLEKHWFSLAIGGSNNFGLEGDDPKNPKNGFFIDTDSNHHKAMYKEATRVEHSELPDGTPAKTMWFNTPEEAMDHVDKIVTKHKSYFHGRNDNAAITPEQHFGSRWTLEEGERVVSEATWHQRQRPTRLWHPELWSAVTDPPNEMTTIMLHKTKEEAEQFRENLRKHHPHLAQHTYILPPGNIKNLKEGKIRDLWNKGAKEISDFRAKYKEKHAEDDAHKVRKGKMTADTYWEKHKHGTYHAADGNHYHYRRVAVTDPKSGHVQHQLHVRKVGSKSASHETFHINRDWSNEQGMRHHKGPSHIDHLYSNPETKPKLEMNEMVMLRPHPYPELIDNFPHIDPFRNGKPIKRKPDLKTPVLPHDVEKAVKAVAPLLKTSVKTVAENMVNRQDVSGQPASRQGSSRQGPKKPNGSWKPNPTSHMTDTSGTNNKQPMSEERFVIKYVLKDTLEEGYTKPWNDPEKAVAHAHKMFASQLYEEVEVVNESVWRHVNKFSLGSLGASSAKIVSGGNPVAGVAGLVAGWKSGYHIGKINDVSNQVDKYAKNLKKYGKEHPKTKESYSKLDNIINQSSTSFDYDGADSSERHYFRNIANIRAVDKHGIGTVI